MLAISKRESRGFLFKSTPFILAVNSGSGLIDVAEIDAGRVRQIELEVGFETLPGARRGWVVGGLGCLPKSQGPEMRADARHGSPSCLPTGRCGRVNHNIQ